MKVTILQFLFLLFLYINFANSQSLYFCEGVDENGKPLTPSNAFNISSKGGYLYFYVDLGFEVETDEIYYEIYRVDSKGKEIYDRTEYKKVDPKSKKFSHQVMFFNPGKYNIYVYKGNGIYLTSNSLRINLK